MTGPTPASTGAPTPPPRAPRGRPAQLSRERIVAAALQGDLESLTMRELAGRLGVSHGALYRWVGGRDELMDLVSTVLVDRIVPAQAPTARGWRAWLRRLAWAMHDEFLAVPGYAIRTAGPHRHNERSYGRLRAGAVEAFRAGGASPEMAGESWVIFATSLVGWLAAADHARQQERPEARFDLFLDTLLRGLPAREPAAARPPAGNY